MKRLVLSIIRLYQKTISPDHGWFSSRHPHGYCRYYPSCSQYMYESIESAGLLKGIARGFFRILRCNPFSHGGYDPVKK